MSEKKEYTKDELKEKSKEVLKNLNTENKSEEDLDDEASKIADLLGPALAGIVDEYNKNHNN